MSYLIITLGGVVNIYGIFSYSRDTLQGKTRPNRATWLMWAIAPIIAGIAALAEGAGWASVPVLMAGVGSLFVLLASFVNSDSFWQLGTLDYVCAVLSLLALILWQITREPEIAIAFAILSDVLATAPTIVKSWEDPDSESPSAYVAGLFNALTSFTAFTTWNFSEIAFPLYLVFVCTCMIITLYRRKLLKLLPLGSH